MIYLILILIINVVEGYKFDNIPTSARTHTEPKGNYPRHNPGEQQPTSMAYSHAIAWAASRADAAVILNGETTLWGCYS